VTDSDVGRAVAQLVNQVAHWEQARWAAAGRADRVYELVQRLADAAADAERAPRRVVPRLADQVLPDQLRVLAADLRAADPPAHVCAALAADVRAVRDALSR
jgi:regulator of protease activity HflC (stomatin/prohibitin superfamily)